jgi:hypothetical protein
MLFLVPPESPRHRAQQLLHARHSAANTAKKNAPVKIEPKPKPFLSSIGTRLDEGCRLRRT